MNPVTVRLELNTDALFEMTPELAREIGLEAHGTQHPEDRAAVQTDIEDQPPAGIGAKQNRTARGLGSAGGSASV